MQGPFTLISALVLAFGIAAAGFSVGEGIQQFRMADRSVTVKGLAELEVESDYALWTLRFRRAGDDFSAVQRSLSEDRARVSAHLRELGFQDEEIDERPVLVEDLYAREWAQSGQPFRFSGEGRVLIKTPRVEVVEAAANRIDPLIEAGVQLVGGDGMGGIQFQLRGFNEIKPLLLAEATRNAREQAEKFALDAGAGLGELKNANQGVIRVLDDEGNDFDNGQTRIKRLRVVSTFEYFLR